MIIVHKVPKNVWAEIGADTHRIVFREEPPETQQKMDYALVAQDTEKDLYINYVTCRELDSDTVYWGYGGTFPTYKNTLTSWRA